MIHVDHLCESFGSVTAVRDVSFTAPDVRRLRDRGACILFSSHVLDEVRALCDNIVIISHGQVLATGDAEEMCRRAECTTLEDAFLTLIGRGGVVS